MDSILTPSEMDALLKPSMEDDLQPHKEVKALDLVTRDHQAFALLPQLNEASEVLASHLGRICTQQIRCSCSVETSPVEVMPASRLPDLLGDPRFKFSLNVNGRPGAGVLTMDAVVGDAFVQRQFGGDLADLQPTEGPPSPTEKRTAGRLAAFFTLALESVLGGISALKISVEQTPPRLLSPMTQGVSVVEFVMMVTVGEQNGLVGLVLDTSAAGFKTASGPPVSFSKEDGPLRPILQKVTIAISAVLGRAELSLGQVLALKPGDLLPLDTFGEGEAQFLIEGKPKFTGSPTVHRGSLSVKLQERIEE